MVKIRRLNLDTSWEIIWDDSSLVLDPWLIGSEVDYFKWFNEQWHTTKPVHPSEIKKPKFILISQSYSDHTHEETLKLFDEDIPILASPKAFKRLRKIFKSKKLIQLPLLAKEGYLDFEGYQIASVDPGNKLDPVYYAHIIKKDNKAIFYSSHGFVLSPKQLEEINKLKVEVLLTSFSEIKLPKIMGGKVNPGLENVNYLVNTLQPKEVLNTHDEQKTYKGLVMKIAKCHYPDLTQITFPQSNFTNLLDYSYYTI